MFFQWGDACGLLVLSKQIHPPFSILWVPINMDPREPRDVYNMGFTVRFMMDSLHLFGGWMGCLSLKRRDLLWKIPWVVSHVWCFCCLLKQQKNVCGIQPRRNGVLTSHQKGFSKGITICCMEFNHHSRVWLGSLKVHKMVPWYFKQPQMAVV